MGLAEKWCLLAAGSYLLIGMLTGAWKYHGIRTSPEHKAHTYVSLAHQASLAYAFASVVLGQLARYSPYSESTTMWAACVPLAYFGLAIVSYVIHGVLKDTHNQFAEPHRLGKGTVSPVSTRLFMWSLGLGEIGGASVLLWGFVQSQLLA
ncbi:hypothetical protein [Hydrogenophaga sp. 5NK40-0174]|uniref:hypothetical protein n=1 Tax=Hydrogenophaga sp. 5NK40-0174 TaxID=3127649 RepID=UPI0031038665